MRHALSHPDRALALTFLVSWPYLEAANRLVRAHHNELDGRDCMRLRPAAEALARKFPAAAMLLYQPPYPATSFAHGRLVMDAMRSGICISLFQASLHASRISS